MWKKFDSAGDAFGSGFGGVHTVATVMLRCSTKVPTVDTMYGPGASAIGRFMDQNFGAGRCERGFVKVESAI